MYMEEHAKRLRREAGEERPEDTPISGDIADMVDLGVNIDTVS